MGRASRAGLAVGLGAWAACAPAPPGAWAPSVAPSAELPAVPVVSFEAPGARRAAVRIAADGREVAAVLDGDRAVASIVGLAAGQSHVLVPVADGREGPPTVWRAPPPPEVLSARVEATPGAEVAQGYVMASVLHTEASGVGIWNGAGELVWWALADPAWTAAAPRPSLDGCCVRFAVNDRARATADQALVEVAFDGSARRERITPLAHHMVAELDRSELAWLAWDIREVTWQDATTQVLADTVRVGAGGDDGEVVLSFFDDRGPPFLPCSHGLIPEERLGIEVLEWTHANSIVWEPQRDRLVVLARLLDAVLSIDRETGAVAWQLGGVQGTLALGPQDAFSHGHLSDAWDGGMLVFDNGVHRDPQTSRVVEYAVDEAAGSARIAWSLDLDGRFVPYLGDARRLPGGDVLVATGELGTIEEYTREGQRRWRLSLPPEVVVGRVWFLPDLP